MTLDKVSLFSIVFACAIWAVKEIYSVFKDKTQKNTEALYNVTRAIDELRVKMDGVISAISLLPKMQRDISEAHSKIREDRARRERHDEK